MGTLGKEIHELSKKLHTISELLHLKGKIKNKSFRTLSEYIGRDPTCIAKSATSGRLSEAVEQELAKIAEFDITDLNWCDARAPARNRSLSNQDYTGRDTADRFRIYLFSKNNIGLDPNQKAVPRPPVLGESEIISFAIEPTGQSVSPSEPITIFFRAIISPGYLDRVTFGFNRVRMKFIERPNSMLVRFLKSTEYALGNDVTLHIRGGPHLSEWSLVCASGALNGEYFIEDPLLEIDGLRVGDSFQAEISVNYFDGTIIDRNTGAPIEDPAKSAVISALIEKAVRSEDPTRTLNNGWIRMGVQKIDIKRGDE